MAILIKCLKYGFIRMWAAKEMVYIYYGSNFLFAILLILPIRAALGDFIDDSLLGARLGGHLDFHFIIEFIKHKGAVLMSLKSLLLVIPLLYWCLTIFLSGGAFEVFMKSENFQRGIFWGGAARYVGRFFRLMFLCLLISTGLLLVQLIFSFFEWAFFVNAPPQNVTYWIDWIKVGWRFFCFFVFSLLFDYARIYVIASDDKNMKNAVWQAILFIRENIKETLLIAFLFVFIGLDLLILYDVISDVFFSSFFMSVIILFIFQQLFIFGRMMLRLFLFSSEVQLYINVNPMPEAEAAPDQESGDLDSLI